MKMKPAERRAVKGSSTEAQNEIARLERSLQNLTPGTLPHDKLTRMLRDARARKANAEAILRAGAPTRRV
ncbi:hypothetical protein H8F21_14040 [Pseudomonas sp. P66]|uniref:Uncharacterized protein n=1 Tax=Pseudomonas arcuscaelestis TaxID=2710591 RepID=A0ABS2BYJ4_9PSED|nr:hypothetical protein [Pseudomonas arcuscaelestis]MBM5458685.1 hypothetical protein [Pseudomonas arcuscaelestis]